MPAAAKPNSTSQWTVKSREAALAANSLDELRNAVAAFEGLEVKTTATNMVFSDGNPKARVMVIGEAPGADEDMQGKPFVGRSGQLLDKILASAGLARTSDDVKSALYISNVLNWRPPGNRTPTPQETETCLPFLRRQIELARPEIVVALGGAAAQSLFRAKDGIMKLRGRWLDFEVGGRPVKAMATLHPAYLLRSPAQKSLAWRDLKAIRKALGD